MSFFQLKKNKKRIPQKSTCNMAGWPTALGPILTVGSITAATFPIPCPLGAELST